MASYHGRLMDIRILQLNCSRAQHVMNELSELLLEERVDVALLQEPYVCMGRVCGMPLSTRVYSAREGVISAAIVVSNDDFDVVFIPELCTGTGVCVCVERENVKMYFCTLYSRFGGNVEEDLAYLERVLAIVGNNPFLLGMDANAVSPLWFSKGDNRYGDKVQRGILIEDVIVNQDLVVLNEPCSFYTFSSSNGSSDIDVSVVNRRAKEFEWHWQVCPDWAHSDHNAIKIDVSFTGVNQGAVPSLTRWCVRDVDWSYYEYVLAEQATRHLVDFAELGVDAMAETLTQWVTSANDIVLRRRRSPRVRAVKWWTPELTSLRRECRRKRKWYQRARRDLREDVGARNADYRESLGRYKRAMSDSKRKNWEEFVAREGESDPWGAIYRICRGNRFDVDLPQLTHDGLRTSSWGESADVLLRAFFPRTDERLQECQDEICVNYREFTWEEIESAVSKMTVGKAPGIDGLEVLMLRSLWSVHGAYMKFLYDRCLATGQFPTQWKQGRVVVLLKSEDRARDDPGSYRPITLLSVLGKVLERLLVRRLEPMLDGLHRSQYGFIKGCCVEDAWQDVKTIVKSSVRKYVLGVFVDFKGAFDNLLWSVILERLREIGCMEVNVWRSYFRGRRVCLNGKNASVWRRVERGCPQGSVCGPVFWNLCMDTLLWQLDATECKFVAYADDLLLVIESDSRAGLERSSNFALSLVREWGERVGVGISGSKSATLLLKGRLSVGRPPCVRAGNERIRHVERVKYLGIWVGAGLNFRCHLEGMRGKVVRVVGMFRRVLRKEWGLSRRAVRILHAGLFRACVLYQCSVWIDVLEHAYGRALLNRCERVALYACVRVCRTVSTEAMQVMMGQIPWWLEAKRRTSLYRFRKGLPLSESDLVSVRDVQGLSTGQVKSLLGTRAIECWQAEWDASEKGRVTYSFIPDVSFVAKHSWFDPSMRLGFLLTGHGSLRGFLHARGLDGCSFCACSEVEETWLHVLCECPLYADIRHALGIRRTANGDWDVSCILSGEDSYRRAETFAGAVFERRMQREGIG